MEAPAGKTEEVNPVRWGIFDRLKNLPILSTSKDSSIISSKPKGTLLLSFKLSIFDDISVFSVYFPHTHTYPHLQKYHYPTYRSSVALHFKVSLSLCLVNICPFSQGHMMFFSYSRSAVPFKISPLYYARTQRP